MPREALIVGLGLIGGSAAMALRARGWQVRYIDPNVNVEDIDRVDNIDERSVVILATPVDVAVQMLEQWSGGRPRPSLVTAVCSVMQPLRNAAGSTRFVAGHPLAGSHESGFAAARADLFEGKPWFLDADDDEVAQLVRDCGAIPEHVDAAEHDRAVALTSHLPQVLSTALAAYLDGRDDLLRFAGSGLRTFLRLAGSDASVWKSIIDANRDNIAPHVDEVARIAREIVEGDPSEAFEKAQRLWRRL